MRESGASDAQLTTLYYGASRKLKDAEILAGAVRGAYPKMAVKEVYYGGQPSSDYVVCIER